MTWSVKLDPESGVATVTLAGPQDSADFAPTMHSLWTDPLYRFRMLIDSRDSGATSYTGSDSKSLADLIRHNRPDAPPGKLALVTASDMSFGIARQIQLYFDALPIETLVTRSYEEAVLWLTKGEVRAE